MYNGLEESSLEKERKILLKYQELFQRLKRPLTKEELKEYFQIRNEKKINPDNLLEEVKHFSNYMEAKYKLFHANLHLVVRPARRYAYTSEMDFMDLALEGSLGLMKTVENYNVDREDSFSVYAVMEIRQAISKYINENRTSLKLKENEYMEIKDFQDSVDRLEYITKKKYTAEELSKIFEIPYQEVVGNLYFNPNFNSLDEPVEEDEDTTMESILAGVEVDFEARIFEEELRSILDECFQYLKPQEELVMRFVTGLNEEKRVYDLYEVSKKLKKTRQSTDAIYARAIKKLKLIVERKEIAKQLIYYMK